MIDSSIDPVGQMRFLAGDGEMANRIRRFDWSGHPFGPPETWSQALRAALGICLNSAFPTAIYWGPELRLLYNDAWAPIPGPRHPGALGAPAREVWSDIWHVIEPQFQQVISSGTGLFLENQHLPMRRYGLLEETYWSYSFTAIRDESGAVAGVFNSGHELTGQVLTARRLAFLLRLDDMLRTFSPIEARRQALAALGAHLKLDRIGMIETRNGTPRVVEEWTSGAVEPLGPDHRPNMDSKLGELLLAGRTLRLDNLLASSLLDDEQREQARRMGFAALLAVPWMDRNVLQGVVFAATSEPRGWTDSDLATVEEVLQRTRAGVERERAAERERAMAGEIDHRARNALAVVSAIAHLTESDDIGDYRERVQDRIDTLGRVHTLLAAQRWHPVDLRALVEQELGPLRAQGGTIDAAGSFIALPAELAQTVAVVLHELVTSVRRRGTLAQSGGGLTVTWRLDSDERVVIDWIEAGQARPDRAEDDLSAGTAAALLDRLVEGQLRGTLRRDKTPAGLHRRITFPLEDLPTEPALTEGEEMTKTSTDVPSVLIAEDEALVAMDLELMVEEMGYAVFGVCGTVPEALEALSRGTPGLAILDANLRGTSSSPVAHKLMERGVPVIFATGYEALPEFPDTPTLSKPVSQGALADAIGRLLG